MIRDIQHTSNKTKQEKQDPVEKYFHDQKVLIETQNKLLERKLDSLNFRLKRNELKLEKISSQKKQIKYVYISEIKRIDALDNDGVVREFDKFFSKTYSGQ